MPNKRYQNYQYGYECQLVSIWNAARFYNKEHLIPTPGSFKYFDICRQCGSIGKACDKPSIEYTRLGLKYKEIPNTLTSIIPNIPVELIIDTRYYIHSILVVDNYSKELLVTNYCRGRTCWLEWKNIKSKLISSYHWYERQKDG